jgi:exosortase
MPHLSIANPKARPALFSAAAVADRAEHRTVVGLAGHNGRKAGVVGLLAAIFAAPIGLQLAGIWSQDPDLSHGPLVPVAAAGFAWIVWRQFGGRIGSPVSFGVLVFGLSGLAGGGVLALAAWLANSPLLGVIGWMTMLFGIAWLLGGRESAAAFRFPILFLTFMAPWPVTWMRPLTHALQSWASSGTELALALLGIANSRSGNVIQLANYQLEVGQACSGLRQLTALVALAAAIGFLSRRDARFQITLILLTVPLALVANLIRAVVTALIVVFVGPTLAEGAWHTAEGLIVTSLATVLLIVLAVLLARTESARRRIVTISAKDLITTKSSEPMGLSGRMATITGVLTLLAVSQWLLVWHVRNVNAANQEYLRAPLADLATSLGDWSGSDRPITNPEWLYADQHLNREYHEASSGQSAALWLAYSASGTDRKHHPEICQSVAGKTEDLRFHQTLDLKDGAGPIQQFRFLGISESERVLYWHYTFPTAAQSDWTWVQQIYFRTHFRPASVTVEVTAPENGPVQLTEFARRLDIALRHEIVGPSAKRGSERLQVTLISTN